MEVLKRFVIKAELQADALWLQFKLYPIERRICPNKILLNA